MIHIVNERHLCADSLQEQASFYIECRKTTTFDSLRSTFKSLIVSLADSLQTWKHLLWLDSN